MEGILIRKGVDQCMDALADILIGELLITINSDDDEASLQAELTDTSSSLAELDDKVSQADIESATELLVEKINKKVDIYGFSEAQEGVLIRGVIRQIFALYPGIVHLL